MSGGTPDPGALDATSNLLALARAGDSTALERLFARYLPGLRRWASGRLPAWARDLAETQDLVQDTLLQVFKKIDGFQYRGEGAFQAYLRQAVMNRVRNEIRRADRRPAHEDVQEQIEDGGTSPLDAAIGIEALEDYERGLQSLPAADRDAVIGRVELGMSYEQLADVLRKPSANAARMTVARALLRLADEMKS